MRRFTSGLVVTAAFCLTASCAHTHTRRHLAESRGGVRLDHRIHERCGAAAGDAYFEYDSSELSSGAVARLDALAACFANGPLRDRSLSLVGYTDPEGSKAYNKELGQERAQTVASYLEHKGVPASHLRVSSRGETGASPDPRDWPADRMVDVILLP
jgi:outer membrane protein OmpA-like peptidoglycan-associated protein